jgi:hypothetical protein
LPRIRGLLVVITVINVEFAIISLRMQEPAGKLNIILGKGPWYGILGEASLFFPSSINTVSILRVS